MVICWDLPDLYDHDIHHYDDINGGCRTKIDQNVDAANWLQYFMKANLKHLKQVCSRGLCEYDNSWCHTGVCLDVGGLSVATTASVS